MKLTDSDQDLVAEVEELSGENLYACFQCGKCSASCPFTDEMDELPNQLIRRVQIGDRRILESKTPWVCASCLSCEVECPKGNDIPAIMEAVREITLRSNIDETDLRDLDTRGLPEIALVSNFRKKTG
ncbi:MAG: 4Fe-4S dicluster domain-containing protein [Candidatus Acetothermia bacterium]